MPPPIHADLKITEIISAYPETSRVSICFAVKPLPFR